MFDVRSVFTRGMRWPWQWAESGWSVDPSSGFHLLVSPVGQMIKDVRVSSYGHVFERFAERSRYFLAEVWSVV